MTSPGQLPAQLVNHLATFDREGFDATIDEATAAGMSVPEILDLLFAPAQRWVGAQWESGAWNVAQEHLATTIVSRAVDRFLAAGEPDGAGPILITSAEGEWHTLGPSMVSAGLQAHGYDTVTLGGPLPSGQLLPFLHELAPLCITVSCQMPGNLPGARRMIATAREAGTPALVGGSGVTERRARHLGAGGYARDTREVGDAVSVIDSRVTPIEPLTHERASGFEWVDMHLHSLAADLAKATQSPSAENAFQSVWMVRALNAALLCDEPGILRDQAIWQKGRSALGDGPPMRDLLVALKALVNNGPAIVTTTVDESTDGLVD